MSYDLLVLGSGPGGYVAAIRASQLGMKVGIVEKENLGGICLNWGCIPTKALLKSAQVYDYLKHADHYGLKAQAIEADFQAVVQRSRGVADMMSKGVAFLMKKNNIEVIQGFGKLLPEHKIEVTTQEGIKNMYEAKNIIIATGARARELPQMPIDGKKIIGYRQAMTLETQPKSMIVVGSGAIGTEFAFFYNSMGTDVTLVEYFPDIVPLEDADVSAQLARSFRKAKMKLMTESEVMHVDTSVNGVKATIKTKKGEEIIEADVLLSAVGIKTNIENIGLEEVGIIPIEIKFWSILIMKPM